MASKMVHVRVDNDMKERADKTLEALGLSMSEAIRLFLHRVVTEQGLPFEMTLPNSSTLAAMKEADAIALNRRARFDSAEDLFDSLEKTRKNKRK